MDRVNHILKDARFIDCVHRLEELEQKRNFCRHDLQHFLDVARIGWEINLEENYGLDKELIYAAGLLHDIGRYRQYTEGVSHECASAEIAPVILKNSGFSEQEIAEIVLAILSHRDSEAAQKQDLAGLLYRSDKASRGCFLCKAAGECNWPMEKRNLQIVY